jgi:hypothetical protein
MGPSLVCAAPAWRAEVGRVGLVIPGCASDPRCGRRMSLFARAMWAVVAATAVRLGLLELGVTEWKANVACFVAVFGFGMLAGSTPRR